jgi:hypothetical protein
MKTFETFKKQLYLLLVKGNFRAKNRLDNLL